MDLYKWISIKHVCFTQDAHIALECSSTTEPLPRLLLRQEVEPVR